MDFIAGDQGDDSKHGEVVTNDLKELKLGWQDVTAPAEDRQ